MECVGRRVLSELVLIPALLIRLTRASTSLNGVRIIQNGDKVRPLEQSQSRVSYQLVECQIVGGHASSAAGSRPALPRAAVGPGAGVALGALAVAAS